MPAFSWGSWLSQAGGHGGNVTKVNGQKSRGNYIDNISYLSYHSYMAAIQVKDVDPELIQRLKIAAVSQGLTLRDYIVRVLTLNLPQLPQTVEIVPSGKFAEVQWAAKKGKK